MEHEHLRAAIAAFAIMMLFFVVTSISGYEVPEDDEIRYIDYALNVAEHNVYGLSDYNLSTPAEPGSANAPLYPAFLSLMAKLSPAVFDAFYCAGTAEDPSACPTPYGTLIAIQHILAALGLFFIWCWVRTAFDSSRLAWLTMLGVILSGEVQDMAARYLTENFVLVFFFAFQLALVKVLKTGAPKWWVTAGVALALLTLTRPEYLYIALGLGVVALAIAGWRRNTLALKHAALAAVTFFLLISPWSIRNKVQLDEWSLTAGGYAEAILAYRLTFNRMDLAEWGASFVYWTPDIGDKIAESLLPPESYERFVSKNPNSFRSTAITEVLDPLLAQMPREEVAGHLLATEVFGRPVWFAATTAALFYRGIFVGKYWGIIGLIAYLILLVRLWRKGDLTLLWVSLPIWALVGLHALVSANVPRYNLPLISIYGVAWGWMLQNILRRWWP